MSYKVMLDEIESWSKEMISNNQDDQTFVNCLKEATKKVVEDTTSENIVWWWMRHGGDMFDDTIRRIAIADLGKEERLELIDEAFKQKDHFDT